ncbi:MAG: TolC family protein [Waddliaceae bacterium]
MNRWILYPLLVFFFSLGFFGCRVHQKVNLSKPTVSIPCKYHQLEKDGAVEPGEWWKEFGSADLNAVVDAVLRNNLNLKSSWWKVVQACAQTRVRGAELWPEIITTPGILYTMRSGGLGGAAAIETGGGEIPAGTPTTGFAETRMGTFYLLSNSLTYEVDLWRRVCSGVQASYQEMWATREDLEATALTLTGTVVDLWFTIQEQEKLLEVIDHQIKVSETLLELIELRFSLGVSSSLDVYQQRLQLAAARSEKPPVQSLLQTSENQMRVLMGAAPDDCHFAVKEGLVPLPPFPTIGNPMALLKHRPDLRAQHRRLQAADYEVASAIADLFPRLDLSIAYDFQGKSIKDIFDEKLSLILAELLTPIFDGGRRRAEVRFRKAVVCDLLSEYGQQFLNALLEVEDALVQEREQLKLIEILEKEIKIAKANVDQSRFQYINGLIDYLNVIVAIQSLQDLERRIVTEKKQLLLFRSKLYRALGGYYLTHWGPCRISCR